MLSVSSVCRQISY